MAMFWNSGILTYWPHPQGQLNGVGLRAKYLLPCCYLFCLFVWFDSLRPINNRSVKQGRVFLGWTSTKKTPAVKFFAITFLSSILAKCVRIESCRGEFPPTSPKGLVLVVQTDFVNIDEDFAINWICPFLSLLMTGIICIGVTERGSFKTIFGGGAYPVLQRLCMT